MRVALYFIFAVEVWRMACWTCSLVVSHLHLLLRAIFSASGTSFYPRFPTPLVNGNRPVCIITGATSGLGGAAAYALSLEGFYVVLVGRSSRLLAKKMMDIEGRSRDACLKAFEVDLSSFQSIVKFKHSLQQWLSESNMHCSVQLLINNAGILATSHRRTADGCDQMMETNYIGAFCLTNLLLPLLRNSPIPSRIVNVTSFTHRNVFTMQVDKESVAGKCYSTSRHYPCAYIYEYSKLCLLLFSYELHRQLGLMDTSHQVSVNAVDPGAVKTNIMREIPSSLSFVAFTVLKLLGLLQSPEKGVNAILDAALAPPEVSGIYFFGGKGRSIKSSSLSYDTKLAKKLWETSSDLFQELHPASGDTRWL